MITINCKVGRTPQISCEYAPNTLGGPEGKPWRIWTKDGWEWHDRLGMLTRIVEHVGEEEARTFIVEVFCEEDWEYVNRHYHTRAEV